MINTNIVLIDAVILCLIFYLCLGLYAITLALFIKLKKKPFITNQRAVNGIFITILSTAGYFLFFQNSSVSILIIYLLFVVDLYLLLVFIPSEFRIICLATSPKNDLVRSLMNLNIPFENKNEKFLLINNDNSIVFKKTPFSTFRVILEKGKDHKIIQRLEKEYRDVLEHRAKVFSVSSSNQILIIGIVFLILSILPLYILM